MANVQVVPATLGHCQYIGPRLRQADKEEIWASHRVAGEGALVLARDMSEVCYTVLYEGEPVAMFGCSPFGIGAAPWLLATDRFGLLGFITARRTKSYVQAWLQRYGYLENYVDARHSDSIRWLQWAGFKFDPEPIPYGVDQRLFYHFWMKRGESNVFSY